MGREINRLSDREFRALSQPGRHGDGAGLYLSISTNGGRRWVFLYRRNGRLREMGLGSARDVGLAAARKKRDRARALLADGVDPLVAKKQATGLTFQDGAKGYIAAHESSWKNAKHAAQWKQTLEQYAYPKIGAIPLAELDTAAVLKCIEPIWATKNETAARLRGRIEQVLDWAKVSGYREGENPARWRGHMDKLLARRSAVRTRKHHTALPFAEVPAFMKRLSEQDGIAAKCLKYVILTAARTTEATGSRWPEIAADIWTVPANRMKGKRIHRVPLSRPALAVLREMKELKQGDDTLIFPGGREGRPQSENAMLALLKRMGVEATVHGFRSSFRDWAAETTSHQNEVVEMALAHVIESDTEAAYRRGDLLEKRRTLMDDWARFCVGGRR
jgi:integrase